jgi:hypothetical protein
MDFCSGDDSDWDDEPEPEPEPASACSSTDDDKPWRCFTVIEKGKKQRKHKGTDGAVRCKTGFEPRQLDVAWDQVKHVLPRPKKGHDKTKAYFFLMYVFIHYGIRVNNANCLRTPSTGNISKSTFYRRVRPIMSATANALNLIKWENRSDTNRT